MNPYTELNYHLLMARTSAKTKIHDDIALQSILNRLDNLQAFVEYLRSTDPRCSPDPRPIYLARMERT